MYRRFFDDEEVRKRQEKDEKKSCRTDNPWCCCADNGLYSDGTDADGPGRRGLGRDVSGRAERPRRHDQVLQLAVSCKAREPVRCQWRRHPRALLFGRNAGRTDVYGKPSYRNDHGRAVCRAGIFSGRGRPVSASVSWRRLPLLCTDHRSGRKPSGLQRRGRRRLCIRDLADRLTPFRSGTGSAACGILRLAPGMVSERCAMYKRGSRSRCRKPVRGRG